eukprot:comp5814_c0_seq1/m.1666 comp5814_c0_seq1/g.1666  ORF comp5814_c0_seq1/g.1666 comp5814_c0_seq1/m.1666 type:complete len:291 (-) comp5814_c0_seq1:537-1409(-)
MDGLDFSTDMLDTFFLTEEDLHITPAPSLFPTTSVKGQFHIDPFASAPPFSSNFGMPMGGFLPNPVSDLGPIGQPPLQLQQIQPIFHQQPMHQPIHEQTHVQLQNEAQNDVANAEKRKDSSKSLTSTDVAKRSTKRQKQQVATEQPKPETKKTAEKAPAAPQVDPFSQKDASGQQQASEGGLPTGKMLLPTRLQTLAMISMDKTKTEPVDEETEKKERNCAASARFRRKKREEQLAQERKAQQMKARYEDLLARKEKLLAERGYLEELLNLKEHEKEGKAAGRQQATAVA